MSSLEFIAPFDSAASEFRRVLRPGGVCVVVTPGASPVLDLGLRLLTGRSANTDYGDRRKQIVPLLRRELALDAQRHFPPGLFPVHLYRAFRFRKR
jgi:hypothetical protein